MLEIINFMNLCQSKRSLVGYVGWAMAHNMSCTVSITIANMSVVSRHLGNWLRPRSLSNLPVATFSEELHFLKKEHWTLVVQQAIPKKRIKYFYKTPENRYSRLIVNKCFPELITLIKLGKTKHLQFTILKYLSLFLFYPLYCR